MNKTISFAIMHFTIAFAVAWLLTGSVWVGGLVAVVEPAVNTVAYHWHEKLWSLLQGGTAGSVVSEPGREPGAVLV
jgi:uncharacterized membrane protein